MIKRKHSLNWLSFFLTCLIFFIQINFIMTSTNSEECSDEGAPKMKVLIVLAHPNTGKSINHALAETTKKHLESKKHEVKLVDLHAINFNPVAGPKDFKTLKNPKFFDLQEEQAYALKNDNFVPKLKEQIDLLKWCDTLIFQFPLYWWSYPAILKGWIDKTFAYTYAYGKGASHGKTMMFSFTSGGNYKDRYKDLFAFDRHVSLSGAKMVKAYVVPGIWWGVDEETSKKRTKLHCEAMKKHLDENFLGKKGPVYEK